MGRLFAATSDGCWVSDDAGQTWADRSGGLEKARFLSALEVRPGEPDVLLAGVAPREVFAPQAEPAKGLGFSLFESANGGKSWTQVRRGFPELLERDAIADIRHDPTAPENVIVALASGELWVTRNRGAYWGPLARQIRAARASARSGEKMSYHKGGGVLQSLKRVGLLLFSGCAEISPVMSEVFESQSLDCAEAWAPMRAPSGFQ